MKSKRIKKLIACTVLASMIGGNSANVLAAPLFNNVNVESVNQIMDELTEEKTDLTEEEVLTEDALTEQEKEAINQLDAIPLFRVSPDINLNSTEQVDIIVEFKEEPAQIQMIRSKMQGQRITLQSSQAKVEASHEQFKLDLNALTRKRDSLFSEVKINSEFKIAFNGVAMSIPGTAIEELLELDVVKRIWKDHEIKAEPIENESLGLNLKNSQNYDVSNNFDGDVSINPLMEDSIPFIGVDRLHAEGIKGKGIKIGVLDTGIDYNHPDLTNAYKGYRFTEGENPKSINKSEVLGWDFVENDADPMETTYDDWTNSSYYGKEEITGIQWTDYVTSHGTHVAGTIAAQEENDVPYSLKGVAPEAELYAYRVLGPGGTGKMRDIINAIEKSIEDGMDVINLSLGGGFNSPYDVSSIAINNAALAGVVSVVAAGNNGPNMPTLGTPGAAAMAITVGASDVARPQYIFSCSIDDDNFDLQLFYEIPNYNYMGKLAGKNLPLEFVGLGYKEDFEGKNLSGKIAFIQRGEIYFVEKMQNALDAGAEAVIIFNNVDTPLGHNGKDFIDVPTFIMSKEQGEGILSRINEGEAVELSFNGISVNMSGGDRLADFSSRGPALHTFDIKPDVVAPGVNIFSTLPEFINDPGGDINYDIAYGAKNGTSMATPHVAGIAALILQEHPEYTPFDVKAALMNTAEDLVEDYCVYEEGAGRVNPYEAVKTDVLIQIPDKTPIYDFYKMYYMDEITSSITFDEAVKYDEDITRSKKINVINNGLESKEYEVYIEYNTENELFPDANANGINININESFTVNPNETKEIEANIIIPKEAESGFYGGYIRIVNKNDSSNEYQIPFVIKVSDPGIILFELDKYATSNDQFNRNDLWNPLVKGYIAFNTEMESVSFIIKDGKTGEELGEIESNSDAKGMSPLVVYELNNMFQGNYFGYTGYENDPLTWQRILCEPGEYKLAVIATDKTGRTYEAEKDLIVENTLPEITFEQELGVIEFTEDDLEEIELADEVFNVYKIKGNIYDSTIDRLNEMGYEIDAFGGEINQGKNQIMAVLNGMKIVYPVESDGSFEILIPEWFMDYGPRLVMIMPVDYATNGRLFNQNRAFVMKKGEVYSISSFDKSSITNGEEITQTVNMNNVEGFTGAEFKTRFSSKYYELVDVKINPEFEKYANDNGLTISFPDYEVTGGTYKFVSVSANLEGEDIKGFTGDIPFMDFTFKYKDYTGSTGKESQVLFMVSNLKYYKAGEQESIEVFNETVEPSWSFPNVTSTYGNIAGEGFFAAMMPGLIDSRIRLLGEADIKVYAEAPNGERYDAIVNKKRWEIKDLPVIEEPYKIVLEAPNHFSVDKYIDLSRELYGRQAPVRTQTVFLDPLVGDVNEDNVIDIQDAIEIGQNFGDHRKLNELVKWDINFDGIVDARDMSYIYKNFGEVDPNIDTNVTPKEELDGVKLEDFLTHLQYKGIFVGDATAVDGFTPGKSVKIEVKVHNIPQQHTNKTVGEKLPGSLIIAEYDENDKLITYHTKDYEIEGKVFIGYYYIKSLYSYIKPTENTRKIRYFVWDTLENMEAYGQAFELLPLGE